MNELQTFWIVVGIVLLVGEMLTGGFFVLFIALGCFTAALGAALELGLFPQALLCALVSILGVITLRKPIQRRLLKTISIKADIGNEIQIDQDIASMKQIRVSYQGTTWHARNLDGETLKQGDRVVIVGIDGNVLLIRKAT